MKSQRLIYSLSCPFINQIHYIGKSTQGMIRPLQHLSNSHSEKIQEWVNELKNIGHAPIVNVLEYVPLEEDLDGRERYWIQRELDKNSLLLNSCLVTPLLISNDLDKLLGNGEGMEYLKIANFVKQRRKQIGLDQREFAEKAGVALTVIRKMEQGKTNLNLNGVLQILKMFGCTLDVTKLNK
jgi:y4mF family transcriptional regulator